MEVVWLHGAMPLFGFVAGGLAWEVGQPLPRITCRNALLIRANYSACV